MTELSFFWVGLGAVALIFLARWWGSRRPFRRFSSSGWGGVDVEGDLLRACRGDKSMAERLIRYELDRKPELSRTAAALMALSRLRDDSR